MLQNFNLHGSYTINDFSLEIALYGPKWKSRGLFTVILAIIRAHLQFPIKTKTGDPKPETAKPIQP